MNEHDGLQGVTQSVATLPDTVRKHILAHISKLINYERLC